ncbi:MAG: MBL fold metallo-hydrolase [Oscillospiraceae bacterium]|nr:MBL fold metallo-hydrolase [Oscillospiraceae bacterium]
MKILTYILGNMQTNCYFIINEETNNAVIIDPAAECKKIVDKLIDHNLNLKYIILTHAHFDHMMALEELRDKTNAPLCVHKYEADAVTDPNLNYMKMFANKSIKMDPPEIILNDGDKIKIDKLEIKVMHTPGHTQGSVCYFIKNNIFTGDTLFKDDIGRYDLHGGDYAQLMDSLKKLASIETEYKIYPGHGSSSWLTHEKKHNIYLH